MRRRAPVVCAIAALVPALGLAGLWKASDALLFPSWKGAGRDLAACGPELAADWGPACGNLRQSRALAFAEVSVPSTRGQPLPDWLVRAAENGRPSATGVIPLVHGEGGDRREETRRIPFFLDHGLDVLAIDLGCAGEAPCAAPGLSYGEREAQDVLSAYLFLTARYPRVLAMGNSAGAAAVLVALPAMPRLSGAIVENPFASFERLLRETSVARGIPRWLTSMMLALAERRGGFSGAQSPEHALPLATAGVPVLFMHGQADEIVPWAQSRELAARYPGPKAVWWPERGSHSRLWDADPAAFEARVAAFLAGDGAAAHPRG